MATLVDVVVVVIVAEGRVQSEFFLFPFYSFWVLVSRSRFICSV